MEETYSNALFFIEETLEGNAFLLITVLIAFIGAYFIRKINSKEVKKRFAVIDYAHAKEINENFYARDKSVDESISLKIKSVDPNFDDQVFKEWVQKLCHKYFASILKGNLLQIRAFLDDNFYEEQTSLLWDNYQNNLVRNVNIQDITYVDLYGFSQTSTKEVIKVIVGITLFDYTVDTETEEIIKGNDKAKKREQYILTFTRDKGIKSSIIDRFKYCPNCGSPLDSESNTCKYCDTWLINDYTNWLLTSIKIY